MPRDRVVSQLAEQWQQQKVVFSADDLQVTLNPLDMGVRLDAAEAAQRAYAQGRHAKWWWLAPFQALKLNVEIAPRYIVDMGIADAYLTDLSDQFSIAPTQPQIVIANGVASAREGALGQRLDVAATLAVWEQHWPEIVQQGQMAVVTQPVEPADYAVNRYVEQVNQVLARPIVIQGYDPIKDERVSLEVSAEDWVSWLQFSVKDDALFVDADANAIAKTLEIANAQFDGRYYSVRDAEKIRRAITNGSLSAELRIFYPARIHTVATGETLASIGADYGIPYPYLIELNSDIDPIRLREGDLINIPSPDSMIPLPVFPAKRIVVDLGKQQMIAYENGAIKWQWPVSTGIAGSPTSPGIFQIQTHEPNAFATRLDLNLPKFMGIYRPVPDLDFMNGFHGFPTEPDGKKVWTDRIGRQGTYGCIMLPDNQATQLFDWAEQGMIVEVRR
ncbi:MAG TPA: LysM peptidoglycan-binding domain-containing protein [Anaerolineae bacterium]|nr:LysM peptidoglycan-binding domain-containing protein [Anaerolineae bacterium]